MIEPCCKGVESGYIDPNGVKFLMCDDTCTCSECKTQKLDEGIFTGEYVSICPACSNPIDYCQGHGEIGDPDGYRILNMHDDDVHAECAPNAECRRYDEDQG